MLEPRTANGLRGLKDRRANTVDWPSATALVRRFGTWRQVCEAVGVRLGTGPMSEH
jgi:hypothetical protein